MKTNIKKSYKCSSMLNATPVTNAFLSCIYFTYICFCSDDVLEKHVGPSSIILTFQFQLELYFHPLCSYIKIYFR